MEVSFDKAEVESEDKAKEDHLELLNRALEVLNDGALEKVVLSRKIPVERKENDLFLVYSRLLAAYPNAFRYLWHHPEVGTWMGATPETLLHVQGDELATMSLAGTQAYRGSLQVEWGEKEREEQAMVTREILQRLKGSCKEVVAGPVETVKAGKLLHLMTPVKGKIRTKEGGLREIIAALHPTPAVCGLPRMKAREFILSHEGYDRTYYTGYLGPVNYEGNSRLYVNLRCMEVTPLHYHIFVGGGITKDSDAESEWEETVNKSKTMMAVL